MRAAVVGIGDMGTNHARIYSQMPSVDLVGVADADASRADAAGRQFGCPAYSDPTEMVRRERVDAVSVVVPTSLHHAIAKSILEAGSHVLVEKPIAATIEESEDLIATAGRIGKLLAVGHIERFNPAIVDLKRRIDAGECGTIYQLLARRLGPFPSRIRDVGVIVDLATHDLDIMRFLTGSEPVRLYCEHNRNLHSEHEDLCAATARFENGSLGVLEVNWLTPTKIRELYVTGQRGTFVVDYLTQDLRFYENSAAPHDDWPALAVIRGVSEGSMTRYAIKKREPLAAELEAFMSAAGGGEGALVSGDDGLAALRMALALVRSGETHQVIELEGAWN